MPPKYDPDGPCGIGGWLLIPLLGLIVVILTTGVSLIQDVRFWVELLRDTYGNDWFFAQLPLRVKTSLLSGTVLLIVAPICLILMLLRSPRTPNWMIGYYMLELAVALIDYLAIRATSFFDWGITLEQIGAIIVPIIGISYFRKSRRVANTFRRPDKDETHNIFS